MSRKLGPKNKLCLFLVAFYWYVIFFYLTDHIDKFEGDIKLSPNVQALVAEGVRKKNKKPTEEPPGVERGAVNNKIYLWTNGIVPYEVDSVFGKC